MSTHTQTLRLSIKTHNKGKNYWNPCGAVFVRTNDDGEITSIAVEHTMFPSVEMVAFPRQENNDESSDEQQTV